MIFRLIRGNASNTMTRMSVAASFVIIDGAVVATTDISLASARKMASVSMVSPGVIDAVSRRIEPIAWKSSSVSIMTPILFQLKYWLSPMIGGTREAWLQ